MLKLLIPTSFMLPILFFSATNTFGADNQFSELSTSNSLEGKVVSMSECKNSDLYIFFHGQYIEMHSMDHLNSAMQASAGCKVSKITVSYSSTGVELPVEHGYRKKRSTELNYIFEDFYGLSSVSYDKPFKVDSTSISKKALAKISVEFDTGFASIAS